MGFRALNMNNQTVVASSLFILVLLGNAVVFSIVPYLSQPSYGFGYHAFQIMLCYSAIATIFMLPWAYKQGVRGLIPKQKKYYIIRSLLEYGSFTVSFYSLRYLGEVFTLPMHTALNFVTPLFATIVAILVLKEKSYSHTWISLGLGFLGVLVITQPGVIPASPGVIYVLLAAFGFSLCGIVIKLLTRTESPKHIAFYMLLMTTILALPLGISHWKAPNAEGWALLGVIGVIAFAQQILVAKAISKVPFMTLIPLNFVQLVFASVLSYLVYSKLIDFWTFMGALVILVATLYNAYRNTKMHKKQAGVAVDVL
jgi:drug/metabolite transporter (DMT)-like permease